MAKKKKATSFEDHILGATQHYFNNGYFHATEEIMNWMNSIDSSEMEVKDFRKILNLKLLDMRPK